MCSIPAPPTWRSRPAGQIAKVLVVASPRNKRMIELLADPKSLHTVESRSGSGSGRWFNSCYFDVGKYAVAMFSY